MFYTFLFILAKLYRKIHFIKHHRNLPHITDMNRAIIITQFKKRVVEVIPTNR